MKYQLVIFDWDGTLMDSVPRIVSCVQALAQECQLAVPSVAAIHDIIGLSLPVALQRLFNCHEESEQARLIDVYRQHYVYQDRTPSPLFAGAEQALTDLKGSGAKLAVATGKARPGLQRAWEETQTGHYFVSSRCAKEVPSKPHPAMLQEILQETGVPATQAVMIGDSIHDMRMAQQAGVDAIGVTYGVHDSARLQQASPAHVIDDIRQLPPLLLNPL